MVTAPIVLGALVAGGLALFAVALVTRDERKVKDLTEILETQFRAPGPATIAPEVSSVLARAGRIAERGLADSGILANFRAVIERSDYKIKPGELVAVSVMAGVIGAALGFLSGGLITAVLIGVLLLVLPYYFVNYAVKRRRRKFEDQLPDVLDLVAASLESGAGIPQALELVVAEADEPSASEFARVLAATRLGVTLVDGLRGMSERLGSTDLNYTVQAIAVQQRTGGRLADVLRVVGDFMRKRAELKRDIAALTAEGRLSAYILGGLPFGIAIFVSISNKNYLNPLFTTQIGIIMLAGTGVLMAVAFYLMSRIIKIDV